jgi:hypothetical protein
MRTRIELTFQVAIFIGLQMKNGNAKQATGNRLMEMDRPML